MALGHDGGTTGRSLRMAGVLGRALRPLVDVWSPEGYQLRLMRGMADACGVVRRPFATRVWPDIRVPGQWVCAPDTSESAGVLLYLHGGGYVFGSARSHFGLVKRLSSASGLPALFVEYRRAPEHPFPAAADDALAAYRSLLDRGIDASRITLAGDSVGGHLASSVLCDLARLGLPMPAAVAMFSPALDCTGAGAKRRDDERRDPVISPAYGLKCLHAYLAGTDPAHPRVAVLNADLRGWPPVLIQVGDTECLQTDAHRMADALASSGVSCELQVWPGQVHVFQALARYLPEARDAIDQAGEFLRSRLLAS